MDYFVREAYLQALKSTMEKRYGAVLVYRNKIIAKGYNYEKNISTLNRCYLLCN